MAISLKFRPLAALYPHIFFSTDTNKGAANAVGMIIPPRRPLIAMIKSKARDPSPIKRFFMGEGYIAARGLISWETTNQIKCIRQKNKHHGL